MANMNWEKANTRSKVYRNGIEIDHKAGHVIRKRNKKRHEKKAIDKPSKAHNATKAIRRSNGEQMSICVSKLTDIATMVDSCTYQLKNKRSGGKFLSEFNSNIDKLKLLCDDARKEFQRHVSSTLLQGPGSKKTLPLKPVGEKH